MMVLCAIEAQSILHESPRELTHCVILRSLIEQLLSEIVSQSHRSGLLWVVRLDVALLAGVPRHHSHVRVDVQIQMRDSEFSPNAELPLAQPLIRV